MHGIAPYVFDTAAQAPIFSSVVAHKRLVTSDAYLLVKYSLGTYCNFISDHFREKMSGTLFPQSLRE